MNQGNKTPHTPDKSDRNDQRGNQMPGGQRQNQSSQSQQPGNDRQGAQKQPVDAGRGQQGYSSSSTESNQPGGYEDEDKFSASQEKPDAPQPFQKGGFDPQQQRRNQQVPDKSVPRKDDYQGNKKH